MMLTLICAATTGHTDTTTYTHPYLPHALLALALPLVLVAGVAALAFGVMLPLSFLMGWL